MAAYSTNGGQDPQNFTNDIPTAFENPGLGRAWRAYDRAIRVTNDLNSVEYFVYQGNQVWELFDGNNWQSVLVLADQEPALNSGVHTGLYHVTQYDGVEHVCGLYQTSGGETGFVKYDPRTNTWTGGAIPGTTSGGNGATSGKCVPFEGRLYHPVASRLQEYDPLTDTIFEYVAPPGVTFGSYAKPIVCQGRLFLATDEGFPRLLELAYGALVDHGAFEGISIGGIGGGGDVFAMVLSPAENFLTVVWPCFGGGGFGLREHVTTVPTGSARGSALASYAVERNLPDGSIPDGICGTDSFSGFAHNASWLADLDPLRADPIDGQDNSIRDGAYQLEQFPAFTPSSGFPGVAFQPAMTKWGFPGAYSGCGGFSFGVDSVARVDQPVDPPTGDGCWSFVHTSPPNRVTLAFSQNTGQWANVDRLLGRGPSITAIRVEPYSDGVITRGMRLTFKVHRSADLGEGGSDLYFGYGRRLERQNARMSLSVGSNPATYPGGVATFDAGTNRLKTVPPGGNRGGTRDRGTIRYTSPTGVPVIGEILEGQTSGETCILRINASGVGAMHVSNCSGGAFTVGETLLGLTSGATFVASAAPATSPYAVVDPTPTYQIVWDLDADGVPDLEWVTLQAAHFANGFDAVRYGVVGSADWQVQVISTTTLVTPATAQGPVAQPTGLTSATPATTQGPAAEADPNSSATPPTSQGPAATALLNTSQSPATTQGPAAGYVTSTSETPTTTQGPAAEITPDADLEGRIVRPEASGRPAVRGGGVVGVFDNDTDQGQRDALSFLDPTGPVLPGQAFEGEPALPAGPVIRLRLDGAVELGRATVDCVNDALNTTYDLLDVTASGLHAVKSAGGDVPDGSVLGVGTLAVQVRLVTLNDSILVQPSLSVGVGGTFDDHVPTTQLSLMAQDEVEDLPLIAVRPLLRGGDVLRVQLDALASMTPGPGNYTVEVVLFGLHRISG